MRDNEFYEQVCKHILLSRFSNLYEILTEEKQHYTDSPKGIDLFEPKQNVGIEITEANLGDGYNNAIHYGLDKQQSYDDDDYSIQVHLFQGVNLGFSINTKHYNNSCIEQDKFIFDRFIYALENKNNKYDEHYSEFNADLFIHDLLHMNQLYDIQQFITNVLEYLSNHDIKFRYIYFETFSIKYTIVIQFDVKNKSYTIETISNHEMDILEKYTYYKDMIDADIQKRLNQEGS